MRHTVVFQPSGRRGVIPAGNTLLEAARALGVDIESICNGAGTCAKCKVKVDDDAQASELGGSPLSPLTQTELQALAPHEIESHTRLACQARIQGDVLVFVPEQSRRGGQVVRKAVSDRQVAIDAAVKKYKVVLAPPALTDSRGDVDRLLDALAEVHGLRDLVVDYTALKDIPSILRQEHWQVTATVWEGREVISVEPGLTTAAYGVAVDIGTTTVAVYLVDLLTGHIMATESAMNPQVAWGEDVISRLTYSAQETAGLQRLHSSIVDELSTMIERATYHCGLEPRDIMDIAAVGNTAMHHLLLNIDPRHVGFSPYAPAMQKALDVKARDLGLAVNQGAYVHVLPNIAGFVGADTVGVLIAEEPYNSDEVALIIDIGTNGELVLGNRQKLIAASCATGPALEGAHIEFGMRAAPGAIERVRIDPETLQVRFQVIGKEGWNTEYKAPDVGAKGICGSGIIDAVAEMFKAGIILKTGNFNRSIDNPRLTTNEAGRPRFVLAWAEETAIGTDITVSIKDIRAVQLAKGALYAGAKGLLRKFGLPFPDRIVLAGAFGSYVDKEQAMAIGLLPNCDCEAISSVGNAAGAGARLALLSMGKRLEAAAVARKVDYIELATEPTFQTDFVEAMHFPHMKDRLSQNHVTTSS